MKLIVIVLSLTLFLTIFVGEEKSIEKRVRELETLLDNALPYDKPIKLVHGTNFLAPPGNVIFLSKDEGMRRMVEFARKNEYEFAILFLPEWGAWITETITRAPSELHLDTKYMVAACSSGIQMGMGHIHNALEIKADSPEVQRAYLIQSAMPSDVDLGQFDSVTRDCPNADIFGFISNFFGTTYYKGAMPGWTTSVYVHEAVKQEGVNLNKGAHELSLEKDLMKFTEDHQGFIHLWFVPESGK